jgi:transposase InsO family protein
MARRRDRTGPQGSGGTYGTLRVTAELRYGRGIHVGKGQVHLLMRRLGIYGLPKRRLPRGARVGKPNSLDLVRRRFKADRPDRLWMTDITEHPTREGKIYCCAVIDAFSRMVVGWSIDSRQTGLLVTNALGMALNRRAPSEGGIIHSDQGVQFASWIFSQKVTEAGLAPSVGAVGAPFDNAMVEAFSHAGRAAQPQKMEDKGLSSPPRSTTTSRSGTTHADATAPDRCSHQLSSRTNTNTNRPPPDSDHRLQETRGRPKSPSNPGWLKTSPVVWIEAWPSSFCTAFRLPEESSTRWPAVCLASCIFSPLLVPSGTIPAFRRQAYHHRCAPFWLIGLAGNWRCSVRRLPVASGLPTGIVLWRQSK